MKVGKEYYRTIWKDENKPGVINIIDQRWLPHKFIIETLKSVDDVTKAIQEMHVRGAPLIGITAAYGLYISSIEGKKKGFNKKYIFDSAEKIKLTRPTAKNLFWALDEMLSSISGLDNIDEIIHTIRIKAKDMADKDVADCKSIGEHGFKIIEKLVKNKSRGIESYATTMNILTHCNAGWLATVDYGTALAPLYIARERGLKIHVWVDETRPRNQGAKLTAWELTENGIPNTVIVDNAGGHLMQKGMVDLVIVGSDRTTASGDVANKIGTYLKALSAYDNNIPFYAALPSSSIDWEIENGEDIPIEERNPDEVRYVNGLYKNEIVNVLIPPESSPALNYAFDITPARLVTGLITERGICKANKDSIAELFPDKIKK
ncbi:MAG: S-methyl-5-thioribose-1-phosphate isomerase [Bacteroidetes bacterium]|nr:MAG: S-methyl-5-thioribose-1-phosphate isomerase [Bacteroidota bacterium]